MITCCNQEKLKFEFEKYSVTMFVQQDVADDTKTYLYVCVESSDNETKETVVNLNDKDIDRQYFVDLANEMSDSVKITTESYLIAMDKFLALNKIKLYLLDYARTERTN